MANPTEQPIKRFASQQAFATWLDKNHAKSDGLWIKIAKKDSGIRSVTHAEALEVALCYGWIDGQRNRLDDTYFLQRFTPRRARSIWSAINCAKVTALIDTGQMQPAGLREVDRAKADGRWDAAYASQATAAVPPELERRFRKNAKARKFFESLDSRNRYSVLHRIATAKKPETRERRAEQFFEMLKNGETIYSAALADWDAFEHRGAHAVLRELGQERFRVDEGTETLHAGPHDRRTEPATELRGDDREHRARGDRRALDDAVHDAVVARVALAPHLDVGRAPLTVITEPAAQPCALGRLADEHADTRDAGERVDEQRAAAGDDAAVVAADRIREPHERLAVRMLLPPAVVLPRPHGRSARVPHRRDAARTGPTDAGDSDLVDRVEHLLGVAREHVREPGGKAAAERERHAGAQRVGLQRPDRFDRVVIVVGGDERDTGADRRVRDRVVEAGRQRARDDIEPFGQRVTGCERVHRGFVAERLGHRGHPVAVEVCEEHLGDARRVDELTSGAASRPRRRRRRAPSPELRRLELTPTTAGRWHATLATKSRDEADRTGQAEDEKHAAEGPHSAGVYRADSYGESARLARTRIATIDAFPGAIAQSVRAHR